MDHTSSYEAALLSDAQLLLSNNGITSSSNPDLLCPLKKSGASPSTDSIASDDVADQAADERLAAEVRQEEEQVEDSKLCVAKHTRLSCADALRTYQFQYIAGLTAIHILRINFIVGTIDRQLDNAFGKDSSQPKLWSTVFSAMLPLGGVSAPLTGWMLTNHLEYSFLICTLVGLTYGFGIMVGTLGSGMFETVMLVVSFAFVAVGRQLVYSIVFATVPVLFGFEHLGKLIAAINVAVFLVGLLQFPLASLPQAVWDDQWWQINLIMALLVAPFLVLPTKQKVSDAAA